MKSALVLALAGSAVAAPSFSDFLDAVFGPGNNHSHRPKPTGFPGFPPSNSGSGIPFPFPTGGPGAPGATGAPFPPFPFPTGGPGAPGATGAPFPPFPFPTGGPGVPEGPGALGAPSFPFPGSNSQQKRDLHIDYELAPKAAPVVKRREVKYRQLGGSALPSFSLLDPNDTPTATAPATGAPDFPGLPTGFPTDLPGLPTGTGVPEPPTGPPTDLPGLPTGLPTPPAGGPTGFPGFPTPPAGGPTPPFPFPTGAPFPPAGTGVPGFPPAPTDAPFPPSPPAGTGAPGFPGFPGMPTTLLTRGPQPTAVPDLPGQESEGEETENGNGWLDWISDLLSGGRGQN
ncbi:hypothetical protein E8E12_007115 [Didymella heteroderae]|uniref:Uncharacterized protein n=1 Tax=Didymella heteroderae TaxID=1769908 RepID=A0A9P4WW24_9PLEO|nr:hypothetical protein E8E12_007115 [Didymella heteroderae]